MEAEGEEDDLRPDINMISRAFRGANDEDTRLALNAISTKSEGDLNALSYYVMPFPWMKMAWDMMMMNDQGEDCVSSSRGSKNWREALGQVKLGPLLTLDKTHPPQLNSQFTYKRDYVLIGPNLWLLLKEKFGSDGEVKFPVVVDSGGESGLVVPTSASDFVPLPATGRFPYEIFFDNKRLQVAHVAVAAAAAAKGARRLHASPSPRTSSSGPGPGNVSDDEEDETKSLLPLIPGDRQCSSPVLLLPPSSTCLTTARFTNGNFMRPYGSGLYNLGNTCFMNSTLQCLGHTEPLRKYFLSGAYQLDLNTENPLGTGGELANEFAKLLAEMWTSQGTCSTATNAVYPRNFKSALGRHAEQFIGYDQHDSQELVTYLLDALHEDTNRVTHKPYVEKAEQEDGESDYSASTKAWEMYRKREDSQILSFFMGQSKSRVQCCVDGCGRVSTTYDPFMFLSVPIPGSSERSLRVCFVPLDPNLRSQEVIVRVDKAGTVCDLVKTVLQYLESLRVVSRVELDEVLPADVWQKDIYEVLEMSSPIEKIRDNDETFIFQLKPTSQILQETETAAKESARELAVRCGLRDRPTPKRYKLGVPTITKINRGDAWVDELSKYLRNQAGFSAAFNPKRGSDEDRVKIYNRLCAFIDQCYVHTECDLGPKRTLDDVYIGTKQTPVSAEEDIVPSLKEKSEASQFFDKVERRYDLAVLEFLAGKMRQEILRMGSGASSSSKDGIIVHIRMRKSSFASYKGSSFVTSFPIRISSATTVFGLRQFLASRLARSIRTSEKSAKMKASREYTERGLSHVDDFGGTETLFGSTAELVLRRIPLCFERKSAVARSVAIATSPLGSLENGLQARDWTRPVALASPTSEKELVRVVDLLGDGDIIYLDWPADLAEAYFDDVEFETLDRPLVQGAEPTPDQRPSLTIYDCIDKYCQHEQLAESEMWYCNRCEDHVRAWKQLELYRCPPILIVHLKRFRYSSATHRREKISTPVDFPLSGLDLSTRVAYWTDCEIPIYDCFAVSNHYGGLGGGHYTAHALNDDGVWCYYDDSRVTINVDPKEVVTEAAYLLYYRRRDVPIGEKFVVMLQTVPDSRDPSPIVIHDQERALDLDDISSTNAAKVDDEDGLEVDDMSVNHDDVTSRTASPMGSVDCIGFHSMDDEVNHAYREKRGEFGESSDTFPRQ